MKELIGKIIKFVTDEYNNKKLNREQYTNIISWSNELEAKMDNQEDFANVIPVWISVWERLPEQNKPILLLTSYHKMATAYLSSKTWMDCMRPNHTYGSVTHWMPLPEI